MSPAPQGPDLYWQQVGSQTPNGGRSYGGGTTYYRAMPVPRKAGLSPGALVLGLGAAVSMGYLAWHAWRHR